ncbi:MAG: hypothetical protein Q8787_02865, partial [Sweet potato little leaf phytoplasma]|nr:hypothetical protein [Sweet potato little leaf phytoplasma]
IIYSDNYMCKNIVKIIFPHGYIYGDAGPAEAAILPRAYSLQQAPWDDNVTQLSAEYTAL